jgi:hypothetical protein
VQQTQESLQIFIFKTNFLDCAYTQQNQNQSTMVFGLNFFICLEQSGHFKALNLYESSLDHDLNILLLRLIV